MPETGSYQELQILPLYRSGMLSNNELDDTITEIPKWTNPTSPPAKGTYVQALINSIGPCRVTGYFTEGGWLGLLVIPLDPPEWSVRQNGYNTPGHLFGPEFSLLETAPDLRGPTIEQLEALQIFAENHGRTWKNTLHTYWMDGRDAKEPKGNLLRQVRNSCPGWLYSKANKVVPRNTARRKPSSR